MNNLKHYVEFFYPYNPDVAFSMDNTDIHLIKERNPLFFINEKDVKIGFRFFDVEDNKNPLIKENRINISSMYYYGKYLTQDEIDYIHSIMPYTYQNNVMIRCFCDYLVTDVFEEDKIVDEVLNKSLNKKINC